MSSAPSSTPQLSLDEPSQALAELDQPQLTPAQLTASGSHSNADDDDCLEDGELHDDSARDSVSVNPAETIHSAPQVRHHAAADFFCAC